MCRGVPFIYLSTIYLSIYLSIYRKYWWIDFLYSTYPMKTNNYVLKPGVKPALTKTRIQNLTFFKLYIEPHLTAPKIVHVYEEIRATIVQPQIYVSGEETY